MSNHIKAHTCPLFPKVISKQTTSHQNSFYILEILHVDDFVQGFTINQHNKNITDDERNIPHVFPDSSNCYHSQYFSKGNTLSEQILFGYSIRQTSHISKLIY